SSATSCCGPRGVLGRIARLNLVVHEIDDRLQRVEIFRVGNCPHLIEKEPPALDLDYHAVNAERRQRPPVLQFQQFINLIGPELSTPLWVPLDPGAQLGMRGQLQQSMGRLVAVDRDGMTEASE